MTTSRIPRLPLAVLRVAILVTATLSVQAFDRLNLVLGRTSAAKLFPTDPRGPLSHKLDAPKSIAILGDAILVSDPQQKRIFKIQDGTTTVFLGSPLEGFPLDPQAPLSVMSRPGAMLALRDGSLLVYDRDSQVVQRVVLDLDGGETTITPFMGRMGSLRPGFDPNNPASVSLGRVLAMLERQDGSVLLADSAMCRIMQIHDGKVSVFHQDLAEGAASAMASDGLGRLPLEPAGMVELTNGDVVISDKANHRLLNIAPNRQVTTYMGQPLGEAPAQVEQTLHNPASLIMLPDHSQLMVDHGTELLRITDHRLRQFAGQAAKETPDDAYLHAKLGIVSDLAVIKDGSILVASKRGLLLLSPADALQETLEKRVHEGTEAVKKADRKAYLTAIYRLKTLAGLSTRASDAPKPQGLMGGDAMEVQAEAGMPVHGQPDYAAKHLRVLLALRELEHFHERTQVAAAPDKCSIQ